MTDSTVKLKPGDRVGVYQVVDPAGYAGTLPTARIVDGPSRGVLVVLTGPRADR